MAGRDEGVGGIEDDAAGSARDDDTFQYDGPSVLDSDDVAATTEHGGDRAGAVGHHHLERSHAMAGGDHHSVDLAAHAHRHPVGRLVESSEAEPLEPIVQTGSFEFGDRGPKPMSQ